MENSVICQKYTPIAIRKLLVSKYLENPTRTYSQLSKAVNVPKPTVGRIIKQFRDTGNYEVRKKSGRPKKTTISDRRYLVRLSKSNLDLVLVNFEVNGVRANGFRIQPLAEFFTKQACGVA